MEKNVKFEVEESFLCADESLKKELEEMGCSLMMDSVNGEGVVISDSKHRVLRVRPVRSEEQNGKYWIQMDEPLELIWYDLSVWGYGEEEENRKYSKQDLDPKLYDLLMETFMQELYIKHSLNNRYVDYGIHIRILNYSLLRLLKGLSDTWGCIVTVRHDYFFGNFSFTISAYECIQGSKTGLFAETMEHVANFIEDITSK